MDSLLQILPNLSIGVVAIIALAYVVMTCKQGNTEFLKELQRMHEAFRKLEEDVRTDVMKQLSENSHVMERVIEHIKNHKNE